LIVCHLSTTDELKHITPVAHVRTRALKGRETGAGGSVMSRSIYLAIALVVCGAAVTLFAFLRAPRSKDFAGWDVAFMSGIGAVALGFLTTLVEVITG
jgi:hypothetical protein